MSFQLQIRQTTLRANILTMDVNAAVKRERERAQDPVEAVAEAKSKPALSI
jgi:hypothetical protein